MLVCGKKIAFSERPKGKIEDFLKKKKPARCFISSSDWTLLRFVGYLLQFHLRSDWSRNNKHSRNFLWRSRFYGKDCKNLTHATPNHYVRSILCNLIKNILLLSNDPGKNCTIFYCPAAIPHSETVMFSDQEFINWWKAGLWNKMYLNSILKGSFLCV